MTTKDEIQSTYIPVSLSSPQLAPRIETAYDKDISCCYGIAFLGILGRYRKTQIDYQ